MHYAPLLDRVLFFLSTLTGMIFPVVSQKKFFCEKSVVTLVTTILLSSWVVLIHVLLHLTFTGHHYLTNDTLCTAHYLLDSTPTSSLQPPHCSMFSCVTRCLGAPWSNSWPLLDVNKEGIGLWEAFYGIQKIQYILKYKILHIEEHSTSQVC